MTAPRALSFGVVAEAYRRARPSYPGEAVRWALPRVPCPAVDVGAGTGKLTEALVALGCDVVALEPDDAMRAVLEAALPGVEARAARAEALPVADGSVDAVLAGQAFHWFEQERFLAEAARVLRPGGMLGLLWNVFDDRVEWVAELAELLEAFDRQTRHGPAVGPPFAGQAGFAEPESRQVPHARRLDADLLVELASTRSRTLTLSPADRERLLQDVRRLALTRHGEGTFELPYVTKVWRATRL